MNRNCSTRFLLGKLLKSQNSISTSCSSVDVVLGGGVETGYITEISGESSMGKTQFCFQLCVNAQLPPQLGGLDAEVIFVDTEKTFSSDRLIEMINTTLQENKGNGENLMQGRDINHFLSKLYVFRCIEAVELLAVVHQLSEFVKNHPKVRLIIIDSIAHTIRSEELTTKTRIMLNIVQKLRELTMHTNIGVVVVNQVTTRFHKDGTSSIIPALGETWSYVPAVKILLRREGSCRFAILTKSPTRPPDKARYEITSGGIRDHQQQMMTSPPTLRHHQPTVMTSPSRNIESQNISRQCLTLSQHVINPTCNYGEEEATRHHMMTSFGNDGSDFEMCSRKKRPRLDHDGLRGVKSH